MRRDLYREITDRILDSIKEGTAPWRKPFWERGGFPVNLDGRPYRGMNVILLMLGGYADPRWGTFNSVKKHGGHVRKGEKSTMIVFWKKVFTKSKDGDEERDGSYWMLHHYHVFNATQCDGLPELEDVPELEFTPVERAEQIIANYVWSDGRFSDEPIAGDGRNPGPPVFYGYDMAAYSPPLDKVMMPDTGQFHDVESFYATIFHELVHSTGHEKRLGRIEPALFGTDPYAREELVAEIGASFLSGIAGLERGVDQSAAYLQGWLKPLNDDPKMIVKAAGQAQRAADLILGTTFEEEEVEDVSAVATTDS